MCKLNQGCRLVFYKVNKILRETNIPAKIRIISSENIDGADLHLWSRFTFKGATKL